MPSASGKEPVALHSIKETVHSVVGKSLDEALKLEAIFGYSSGDVEFIARQLESFSARRPSAHNEMCEVPRGRSDRAAVLPELWNASDQTAAPEAGLTATDTAEHRQISIVFTDIVQSTSLTSALGAEAYRELLRAYREIAAQVVAKYKGRVASFVGDEIMICFGFPQSREDDPIRAVQASLELQERVAALNLNGRLRARAGAFQIRIGVHTGVVLAGDIRSEMTVEPMATVGEAPNIAARLQSEAPPGSIIISQDTYELVGNHFDCRFLGAPPLRGIDREVRIFEVHSPAAGDGMRRGRARAPCRTRA